jgi:hypothetical protein
MTINSSFRSLESLLDERPFHLIDCSPLVDRLLRESHAVQLHVATDDAWVSRLQHGAHVS